MLPLPVNPARFRFLMLRLHLRASGLYRMPTAAGLGTNRPTYENLKRKLIKRSSEADLQCCIDLLEHASSCEDGGEIVGVCQMGEACGRIKNVMFHYQSCIASQDCAICQQLVILCQLHAQRCQNHKLGCNVLLCPNKPSSREECKEMYYKLMNALRLSSKEEKMKHINRLFRSDPQTAKRVVLELRKVREATKLMRAIPRGRVIRSTPRGQAAVRSTLREINNSEPLVSWKAKIAFVPNY
uniref:histone acetyltransferase n=2 Tax=Graphocephala atropunctata TaxID=36148 RepID=A0A1B6LG25_9HEMI